MQFDKLSATREKTLNSPSGQVNGKSDSISALIDLSLVSISPTKAESAQVHHHESLIENSAQAFVGQVECLLESSSLLAAVNIAPEMIQGAISFRSCEASAAVKCGFSDSAAQIEIDYTPPRRRALLWRSPAKLEARIVIEGQPFKLPECELSAPGQRVIEPAQQRSWFSSRSRDWTREHTVSQVTQYLLMAVEQALEVTRIQNQGLTVIDLNPRFERDLVAQIAVILNLPEIPGRYIQLRQRDTLEKEARNTIADIRGALAEFKNEINVRRTLIEEIGTEIKSEARLVELRSAYEKQLREQYDAFRMNLEPRIVEEIRNEVVAQHNEKMRLALDPIGCRSRAQILTTLREALSRCSVDEQVVVSSAEKCGAAFMEHRASDLSLEHFDSLIRAMVKKTWLLVPTFGSANIDSSKLETLANALVLVPQYCSGQAFHDFLSAIQYLGGAFANKVTADEMLAAVEMLLNVPKDRHEELLVNDSILDGEDSESIQELDDDFSLSDDSGILLLDDVSDLDLGSLDDSGLCLSSLEDDDSFDVGADFDLQLDDLSDLDLNLTDGEVPRKPSNDSGNSESS